MAIFQQISLFSNSHHFMLDKFLTSLEYFSQPSPYPTIIKGIEKFTKKGDTILDPCCGNGTAGFAALELNRRAILSDINPFAIKMLSALFNLQDYEHASDDWQKLVSSLSFFRSDQSSKWNEFINTPLPTSKAFKRILDKNVITIAGIFHQFDLEILGQIYSGLNELENQSSQKLLEIVFYDILYILTQLKISKNNRLFYLPKKIQEKLPIKVFTERLNLYLFLKKWIEEKVGLNYDLSPTVSFSSTCNQLNQAVESIDYVVLRLPDINQNIFRELGFLNRLISKETMYKGEEIVIDLGYRRRSKLIADLSKLLTEMERILKPESYLTLIMNGHHGLLSLIVQLAGEQGWQLIQDEVELITAKTKNRNSLNGSILEKYPIVSMTLKKKGRHAVLGSLNKLKFETLYDTEEAILRKIDQYLKESSTATTEEIQRHLIKNYLHDCLIARPLKVLLEENFLSSGKYWIRPSQEQKSELFNNRREIMKNSFDQFVCEMVYRFLQEEAFHLKYDILLRKFLTIKPRIVFQTAYYRLLMEESEMRNIKLNCLVKEYLLKAKKDQFETLTNVLRRITLTDQTFIETAPGEMIGLREWPTDIQFKIYFELFEKEKQLRNMKKSSKYARRTMELLDEVNYLHPEQKEKIKRYLMRSVVYDS